MKDMYDCATYEEIDIEWEAGKKRFRELLDNMKDRQQNGDFRMGYSALREIIEGLELNEFILENSEGMGA
jgi:hypothetical protein